MAGKDGDDVTGFGTLLLLVGPFAVWRRRSATIPATPLSASRQPSLADEGGAPTSPSGGAQHGLSRLSPEDRERLSAEGASADEVGWIDAWLEGRPGRTLEDLTQQEERLVSVLRSYRDLMEEITKSKTPGSEPEERLKEARKTAIATLVQIDREVLAHGFKDISADEKMKLNYKNVLLGLMNEALQHGSGGTE